MKEFMCEDFLLSTETSKILYNNYAKNMPIIDYHCHINPQEIAEDMNYENITQAWLYADHYKWRAIRSNGINEQLITGDASDYDKFKAWASTLTMAIGNPLYHWAHLELKRYFGYNGVLNADTAFDVWNICNEKLKQGLSVRSMIKQSNVRVICTTDDPTDDLKWHKIIRDDKSFDIKVLPAWRPDRILGIEKNDFKQYIEILSKVSEIDIKCIDDLHKAIVKRLDFFDANGCLAADHGLNAVMYSPSDKADIDDIFENRLKGNQINDLDEDKYKFAIMDFLANEYSERSWVMQLHYGVKRSVNTQMFNEIGADTGFDCISGINSTSALADFLNHLNINNHLPKTIIYSLNPNDDPMIGSIIGCFQTDEAKGKIQHGSAWWFNDTKIGMTNQMLNLANFSLLGNFLGMLTDSRSFLSYTRHEYFRRVLCELIGNLVENGEYPNDEAALKQIVEGICYTNIANYLGITQSTLE